MGPPPPPGEEKIGEIDSDYFVYEFLFNYSDLLIYAVIMKAVGGEMGSASALAPKLGPLGLVRFAFIFLFLPEICFQVK